MIKKFVMLIVLLAVAAAALFAYGKHAPASRVGVITAYIQRSLPGLFASGHMSAGDIGDIAKGALEQSDRSAAKQEGKTTVYKWRGANGDWTYGNAPPPGVKAVPQEFDASKTNRLSQ